MGVLAHRPLALQVTTVGEYAHPTLLVDLPSLDQFAGKRRMKIDGSGDDMTEDDETLESMVDGPRKRRDE
jgi:hypothetical protein